MSLSLYQVSEKCSFYTWAETEYGEGSGLVSLRGMPLPGRPVIPEQARGQTIHFCLPRYPSVLHKVQLYDQPQGQCTLYNRMKYSLQPLHFDVVVKPIDSDTTSPIIQYAPQAQYTAHLENHSFTKAMFGKFATGMTSKASPSSIVTALSAVLPGQATNPSPLGSPLLMKFAQ